MDIHHEMARLVEGKDGWLFQTDEDVFSRIGSPADPSAIKQWQDLFAKRTLHAESNGAEYFMLIAPEKHVVYREMHEKPVHWDRAASLLHRSLPQIIYPVAHLTCRNRYQTYSKGESHWNGYGASIVAEVITGKVLDLRFVEGENPWFDDLAVRINRAFPTVIYRKQNATGKCIYDNMKFGGGNIKVSINKDKTLPKLVIFRDSFSSNLLPLLAEHFSRIVALATPCYVKGLVESEKPDMVINQMAERYASSLNVSDEAGTRLSPEELQNIKQIGAHSEEEAPHFKY